MTTYPVFPTTVIGSMPRPPFVKDLLTAHDEGHISDADFRNRGDAAVQYVIALQEHAGLDIISDGEWRRTSYIDVVTEVMDGFKYVERELFTYHKCIVRKMSRKREGVVAEEARFLKEHTARGTKVALPSPYLMGTRMWEAKYSRDAYSTREEFMWALVPVIRQELLAVCDVGVDIVQLDEPHLCVFVDEKIRAQFAKPEKEMQLAVDLINAIVSDLSPIDSPRDLTPDFSPKRRGERASEKSPPSLLGKGDGGLGGKGGGELGLAVHLCRRNWGRRGWGAEGGYEAILPYIQQLKVNMLMLEFAIPVAGDVSVLRQLPEHFRVGVGCVDCRFPEIESPETIAARVEKACEHITPDRILLNPDCGFAPALPSDIPLDEAYAKLKNEAEAGKMLRTRYPLG